MGNKNIRNPVINKIDNDKFLKEHNLEFEFGEIWKKLFLIEREKKEKALRGKSASKVKKHD